MPETASWQASVLNLALRATTKQIFKKVTTVGLLRKLVGTLGLWSGPLPSDVLVTRVAANTFDGEWIDVRKVDRDRVILYLPGGGYVMPATGPQRSMLARLCRIAQVRGLIVNYRLAPEHRFPTGLEDCLAAYRHLMESGFEPEHVIIAGDSAGGGLTLATLASLRDDGDPLPAAAVVMSAVTDLTYTGGSRQHNRDADPMVPADSPARIVRDYLDGTGPSHPLVSPIYADLTGLPPVLAQVGSTEILLDDTLRFAEKAQAAGVPVELEVWDGMPHVFQLFPFVPESDQALTRIGAFILDKTQEVSDMGAPTKLVADFIATFNERDIDGIMSFFTEDSVYHNLPMKPVAGIRDIRKTVAYFIEPAQEVSWEILNIAEAGPLVFAERSDRFVIDGKKIELPVVGVFEIHDDKIIAWRDYFDMATWQRQTAK